MKVSPLSKFPTLRFSRSVYKTLETRANEQHQIVMLKWGYDLPCLGAVPLPGRYFCRAQHVCAPGGPLPGPSIQKMNAPGGAVQYASLSLCVSEWSVGDDHFNTFSLSGLSGPSLFQLCRPPWRVPHTQLREGESCLAGTDVRWKFSR